MANEIIADKDYKYDPDHKNKPKGGNWDATESGWTTKKHEKTPDRKRRNTPLQGMMNSLDVLGKHVKQNENGKFIIEDKDWERISSILKKSNGDEKKAYRYSMNMAQAITDISKAVRRGIATYDSLKGSFGSLVAIETANVFFNRALELKKTSTESVSDSNPPESTVAPVKEPVSKPPKFRKMNPKLPASLHYLIKDNDLNSDEVEELTGFKNSIMGHPMMSDKEFKNRVENGLKLPRNQQQLKNSFVKNMDPRNYDSMIAFQKAKERIQKMTVADFGKLLGAIMAEEET